ncbi:MAG: hypothetical protein JKX99_01040 [Robiginitomaculum sp.]|nr:hypothetical protein [Robiginitomaculum sp.]
MQEGFSWTLRHSTVEVKWAGVDHILEMNDATVFTVGWVGYYIPNRLFDDEAAKLAFTEKCTVFIAEAKASNASP